MLTFFVIYSILGYFLESLYISLFKKKWYSSGTLDGPYIPLYGFGACLLIIFSSLLSESYILTFLFGLIIMTILEYITSLFIEKVFSKKYWDYSHMILNYKGRICLYYSILWGILSILFIYFIHPYFINKTNIITELLSIIIICIILKDFINKKRIVK